MFYRSYVTAEILNESHNLTQSPFTRDSGPDKLISPPITSSALTRQAPFASIINDTPSTEHFSSRSGFWHKKIRDIVEFIRIGWALVDYAI